MNLEKLSDGTMEVHTFGDRPPIRFDSPKHLLMVKLQNGQSKELVLNSVDKISAGFKVTSLADFDVQVSEDLLPLALQTREPDVLIGMPDFWQFVQKIEEISSTLHVVHTTIGRMLCGKANKWLLESV
uniref:DUF1758 domain-containing protein n=1 Tax=Ditylenchus dipsaci TaxID=166011 RepID=A0A915DGB1_9BILA